jgi:para-aminobenzoate synthetase/4-amino-4-deoxychorismate lyase
LAKQSLDSRRPFLFHKTTHRSFYEEPLQERSGCDDLIFFHERGEMTESSIANVVIVHGARKLTPPRTAGLLAGRFSDELLATGAICEKCSRGKA